MVAHVCSMTLTYPQWLIGFGTHSEPTACLCKWVKGGCLPLFSICNVNATLPWYFNIMCISAVGFYKLVFIDWQTVGFKPVTCTLVSLFKLARSSKDLMIISEIVDVYVHSKEISLSCPLSANLTKLNILSKIFKIFVWFGFLLQEIQYLWWS